MQLVHEELEGAEVLRCVEGRWDMRLNLRLVDGSVRQLVISADSYLTCGSGIWVGSPQEFDEEMSR